MARTKKAKVTISFEVELEFKVDGSLRGVKAPEGWYRNQWSDAFLMAHAEWPEEPEKKKTRRDDAAKGDTRSS